LLALAALFLDNCFKLLPDEEKELALPLIENQAEDYKIYTVTRKTILNFLCGTGTLVPANEYQLFFSSDGLRLKEIRVNYSSFVKQGEIVVCAEPPQVEIQLKLQQNEVPKMELYVAALNRIGSTLKYGLAI